VTALVGYRMSMALQEVQTMDEPVILKVEGLVEQPLALGFDDLAGLPAEAQVADVSRFQPTRKGDGVSLEAILERARPRPEANYLTLHADRDDFHVSIPLAAVRAEAIVIYKLGNHRLGPDQGGPIRFLIRDPAACHTDELDDCANVKYLSRIELSFRRGRDTRPTTDEEHARLHAPPTS
jgi:DMSO/TMAO reductase YedYZ molybdopterin-dependent catalytic subunit